MRELKVAYCNSLNFGDALSPYIIAKLSGLEILPRTVCATTSGRIRAVLHLIKDLLHGRTAELQLPQMASDACVMAVGSILGWGNSHASIWGCGFIDEADEFHGGRIYALRGGVSLNKLKAAGVSCGNPPFGDPALLLPLIVPPAPTKQFDLGVIPHITSFDWFKEHYDGRCHLIDLRTRDIEGCIHDITSCRYIVSISLHGLIVPHAYGIPALHIKRIEANEMGFKYRDYLSSVAITPYKPFCNLEELFSMSTEQLDAFFAENSHLSLPQNDLARIQRDLLRAAPFPLIDKYRAIANL